MRKIAIQDMRKRSAVVCFEDTCVLPKKTESHKIRRIKTLPEKNYDKVYANENGQLKSDEEIFNQFINSNDEIDFEKTGCEIKEMHRFYSDKNGKAAENLWFEETIYDKDGNVKDIHPFVKKERNISDVDNPLKWTNRYIPYEVAARKFVISHIYRLYHVDCLTFDFLYDIASELESRECLMYMGTGENGDEPVVFRQGGKPYRVFLKGKTQKNKNLLFHKDPDIKCYQLTLLVCEMEYDSEKKGGEEV